MDATIRRALRWGRAGLMVAAVPAVIALVGALGWRASAPDAIPLFTVLGLYFGAGAVLGALIGILLPLTRWVVGAVSVGMISGFMLYSAAVLIVNGVGNYHAGFPIIMGSVLGGPIAFGIWRQAKRDGLISDRRTPMN